MGSTLTQFTRFAYTKQPLLKLDLLPFDEWVIWSFGRHENLLTLGIV